MNYKERKGITLIALVITIVVLLILAGISISLVLGENGIITRAKEARTSQSYSEAFEDVQQAFAECYIDNEGDSSAITASDLQASIRAKGYSTATVTGPTNDEFTVTIGTNNYKISTTGDLETTFDAYTAGETVTIAGQDFYVIEASNENTSTLKLLAKYCLNVEKSGNNYINLAQSSDGWDAVAFDSSTNVYASASIKNIVDTYASSLGVGATGRLLSLSDYNFTENDYYDENKTWEQKIGYFPDFVKSTSYWFGTAKIESGKGVWFMQNDDGTPYFDYEDCYCSDGFGVRPVIIVSKANLPAQN